MDIILRGVRGSIATSTPNTSFYGGNTACLEVIAENETRIFFDAGTGLREAWPNPPASGEVHIFLTHGHADHIVGLWFFKPLHMPGWTTHLYLPKWLEPLPYFFHLCGFFPVPFEQLNGRIVRHLVQPGECVSLGPVKVEPFAVNHPGGCLGYRVRSDDKVLVYTGDHEIVTGDERAKEEAATFLLGADLAVVDAQYNISDYQPGFGHSAWEDWLEVAARSGIRRLVLTHHDPARSDQELDRLDKSLHELKDGDSQDFQVAREGLRLTLGPSRVVRRKPDRLLYFLEELSGYRDESVVLDRILAKAREITRADAGTIYLVEGDELVFAYTHNDSLFSVDEAHRHAYASLRLPLSDDNSIAGYVAVTGHPLNLPDVRNIPDWSPYHFNDSFDQQTGYATISMLTLPFIDHDGRILGVMQLINSLDNLNGAPHAFTLDMERYCRVLAREVSSILKHGAMERYGIYGILRMTTVHDPYETGPHAERVGALAAELYHAWAIRKGYTPDVIRHEKSRLRLAAMLHDIGKVGISDLILKKESQLTPDELVALRDHTRLGASILSDDVGELASLAREIAHHHHQRWDGQGYADSGDESRLAGEDIPLGARITAVADVFDALVSERCYKKPWTFAAAIEHVRQESGRHFDPELVACLDDISELILPIYARYPDKI